MDTGPLSPAAELTSKGLRRIAILGIAALVAVACSKDEEAPPPESAPGVTESVPAASMPAPDQPMAPAEDLSGLSADVLRARAQTASAAGQLFAPAQDNAFEWHILAVEKDPSASLSKNALSDLFPYAVLHVEQRLAANDIDDAQRVIALMKRADVDAPALPRLERAVVARVESADREAAQLIAREEKVEADRERAAAEAARAAQAPPTPTPTPTETTQAPPPAATREPTPPPVEPTPPPQTTQAPPPRPAAPPPSSAPPALKVSRSVTPKMPREAVRGRISGSVTVEFTVGANGRVTEASVVSSDPRGTFDREALEAMRQFRFEPPGQNVSGRQTFNFDPGR